MKYFQPYEFKMGKEQVFDKMDTEFLNQLDEVRNRFGYPIRITSSYRSKEYNDSIGGAPKSMHCKGRAVDIYMTNYTGLQRWKLIGILKDMKLTAGIAKTFIHVDNRDNPSLFGYGK